MRVSRESHPVADLCTDTIGGRTAQIATFLEPRTRRYAAHARWSLGRNEMGEHALGIYASATDPRFHEQMLAILRSVEFVGAPAPSP